MSSLFDILILGFLALFMMIAVSAIRVREWWMLHHREDAPATGRPTIESTAQYRQCVLASASTETQQAWDRHVRPVLAKLASGALVPRGNGDHDGRATLRNALGGEVFRHVDPSIPPCGELGKAGPGPRELARIVEALERLVVSSDERRDVMADSEPGLVARQ